MLKFGLLHVLGCGRSRLLWLSLLRVVVCLSRSMVLVCLSRSMVLASVRRLLQLLLKKKLVMIQVLLATVKRQTGFTPSLLRRCKWLARSENVLWLYRLHNLSMSQLFHALSR